MSRRVFSDIRLHGFYERVSSGAFGWYDETKANAENLLTPFMHSASTYALGTPIASNLKTINRHACYATFVLCRGALPLHRLSKRLLRFTPKPATLRCGRSWAVLRNLRLSPQPDACNAARWQIPGCAAKPEAKSATPERCAVADLGLCFGLCFKTDSASLSRVYCALDDRSLLTGHAQKLQQQGKERPRSVL